MPSPELKEALDLYWKKPVKAPEGWDRAGGVKLGINLFGAVQDDEHRLTSEEAKFPKEIRIQVRQTDEYEMEVGEPVRNLYIALVNAYQGQFLYRLNGVTDEQGCVRFTREQMQEKLNEQKEKDGWAPEIDRLRDKIFFTLWDERKGRGSSLPTEHFRFTEEERAIFARTDNLRYDERYEQPYSVDRRDQDEQGILRGVMPVYPHDEEGKQRL